MAGFDPQVQEQQAQPYLFYAGRPIQEPKPNVGKEMLLKGVGQAIEGGAKVADETVKASIDSTTYRQVDQAQDEYIGRLSQVNDAINQQDSLVDPTRQGTQGQLPKRLQQLPNDVGNLVQARANGKLSDVEYLGNLETLAKGVRAEYPSGYRPYIDSTFERATGRTSANKLIQGLTRNLDAYVSNARAARDKADTLEEGEFVKGMVSPATHQLYKDGKISADQALLEANTENRIKLNEERIKSAFEIDEKNRTATQKSNMDSYQPIIFGRVQQSLNGIMLNAGGKDENIYQLMNDLDTKKINPTSDQLLGVSRRLSSEIDSQYMKDMAFLNTPIPQGQAHGGELPINLMGGIEKVKPWLDAQYQPMRDLASKFTNPETGYNFLHAKHMQGIVTDLGDNGAQALSEQKDLAASMGMGMVIDKMFGGQGQAFSGYLNTLTGQGAKLRDATKAFYQSAFNKGLTQSDGTQPNPQAGELTVKGEPYTMNQAVEHASSRVNPLEGAKLYNAWMGSVSQFLENRKIPGQAKENLIQFGYGPGQETFTDRFSKEDGTKILTTMVTPKIVEQAYKLGPQSWDTFKGTTTKWFNKNFLQYINELGEMQENPNIRITYDDASHAFQAHMINRAQEGPEGSRKGMLTPRTLAAGAYSLEDQKMQSSLDKLNQGINAMSLVARKEGGDVNGYIMGLLVSQGKLPPGSPAAKLLAAAQASRPKKEAMPEIPN